MIGKLKYDQVIEVSNQLKICAATINELIADKQTQDKPERSYQDTEGDVRGDNRSFSWRRWDLPEYRCRRSLPRRK